MLVSFWENVLQRKRLQWVIVASIVSVVAGVQYWYFRTTVTGYDYNMHALIAEQIGQQGRALVPHFVYHLLLLAVQNMLGVDFRAGALFIVLLSNLLLFALTCVYIYGFTKSRLLAAIAATSILLVNPIQLMYLLEESSFASIYLGYHYINVYHSPTMVLLKPLAFVCFWLIVKGVREPRWSLMVAAAVVLVVASFIKPSYTMCVFPTAFVFWCWRMVRMKENVRILLLAWLVSGITLCGQFFLYADFARTEAGRGIVFRPFLVMGAWSDHLFLKFLFSIALVIALLWLNREVMSDFAFQFAAVGFVFGCFFAYLFAETGKDALAGNFVWCAQVTLFLLFVVSIKDVFVKISREGLVTRDNCLLTGVLLAHVAGGVFWMMRGINFNMGF